VPPRPELVFPRLDGREKGRERATPLARFGIGLVDEGASLVRRRMYQATFPRSKEELDEARALFATLRTARSAIDFAAAFASAVNAERSVFDNLRAEGAKLPGFRKWPKGKSRDMKDDELLHFIDRVRVDTLTRGAGQDILVWPSLYVEHLSTTEMGPPADPDCPFGIGTRGQSGLSTPGYPRSIEFQYFAAAPGSSRSASPALHERTSARSWLDPIR
jgi:hypothetical protein